MTSSHIDSPTDDSSFQESAQVPTIGGKVLIVGVLATALVMASFGWWFRFQATHQTAQFWGPEAALLLRDAPHIFAYRWPTGLAVEDWTSRLPLDAGDVAKREIADAPGISHLRTALLEDRSFGWDEAPNEPLASLGYGLHFVDSSQNGSQNTELILGLSEDCRTLVRIMASGEPNIQISSEPISGGLKKVLSEVFGEANDVVVPVASDSSR